MYDFIVEIISKSFWIENQNSIVVNIYPPLSTVLIGIILWFANTTYRVTTIDQLWVNIDLNCSCLGVLGMYKSNGNCILLFIMGIYIGPLNPTIH